MLSTEIASDFKFQSDETSFWTTFNNFHKEHKGIKPPKEWFHNVEESHIKIREKIGGIERIIKIEIESSINQLPFPVINKHVDCLLNAIPSYFKFYGINILDLCSPLIQNNKNIKFNGMRWTKHIGFFINNNKLLIEQGVDPNDLDKKLINDTLASLGGLWINCNINKATIYVKIDTSPFGFVKLGHYNVDTSCGSCFAQQGSHQFDKYMLGQYLNTYVILLSSSEKFDIVEHRLWGLANKDLSEWNISNLYSNAKITYSTIELIIKKTFEEILNTDLTPLNNVITTGKCYNNNNPKTCFVTSSQVKNTQSVYANYDITLDKGLEKILQCCICRNTEDDMKPCDNALVCDICIKNKILQKCEFTNVLTTFTLHNALDENEKPIKISAYALAKYRNLFIRDVLNTEYILIKGKNTLYLYNGDQSSRVNANKYGYTIKCDQCNRWSKNSVNSSEICLCIKKNREKEKFERKL